MVSAKDRYGELCRQHYIPLFMQGWWYDCVCGPEHWGVALAFDENDRPTGAMPYHIHRKWGITILRMPELTPFNGAWINYPPNIKQHTRYSWERKVLEQLIAQLPPFDYFGQNFYFGFPGWLPFFWAGFQETTHYSYTLNLESGPETLWRNLKGNARRNIMKAERQLAISTEPDAALFYQANRKTFERQGLPMPHSFEVFRKLDTELRGRGQGRMYFARDATGKVHAAVYIVWDEHMADVLLTGSDPRLRKSAAIYLLYWQAIRDMAALGVRCFDFEGGMLPNVENVYAGFGATRQPIHIVYKARNRWLALLSLLTNRPYR